MTMNADELFKVEAQAIVNYLRSQVQQLQDQVSGLVGQVAMKDAQVKELTDAAEKQSIKPRAAKKL